VHSIEKAGAGNSLRTAAVLRSTGITEGFWFRVSRSWFPPPVITALEKHLLRFDRPFCSPSVSTVSCVRQADASGRLSESLVPGTGPHFVGLWFSAAVLSGCPASNFLSRGGFLVGPAVPGAVEAGKLTKMCSDVGPPEKEEREKGGKRPRGRREESPYVTGQGWGMHPNH